MKCRALMISLILCMHLSSNAQRSSSSIKFKQQTFEELTFQENEYTYHKLFFRNITKQNLILDTILISDNELKITLPRIITTNRIKDTIIPNKQYSTFIKWSTWDKVGAFNKNITLTFKFKNHSPIIKKIKLKGNVTEMAKVQFDSTIHNSGQIPEGPNHLFEFRFKNIGTTPVIIERVRSSCGCLAPYWTKDPIMPGDYGIIKGNYNTKGRPGNFYKTMTVSSNAITRQYGPNNNIILRIKGKVIKAPKKKAPTPMNNTMIKH